MSKPDDGQKCVVIEPDTNLKDKVKITGSGSGIDMAAIERAEKALEELSENFDDWLCEEIGTLVAARDVVSKSGLEGENRDKLYRAAHDLKGQADTFGYPLITVVCASMCKLMETIEDANQIPMELIDQHIDAIRVFASGKIKDKEHPEASTVAEALLDAVILIADRATSAEAATAAGE